MRVRRKWRGGWTEQSGAAAAAAAAVAAVAAAAPQSHTCTQHTVHAINGPAGHSSGIRSCCWQRVRGREAQALLLTNMRGIRVCLLSVLKEGGTYANTCFCIWASQPEIKWA